MWRSIEKGHYARPMIPKPDKPTEQILKPLSKMTKGNKKQYIANVRVMNYLLQAIPNDIYNSLDACKNAKGIGNDESNQIVERVPQTKSNLGKENVHCYNYNEKGHYARDCQKPRVCDARYFREQMLLAMKDESGSNLKDEENDFMLDNSYGDETLEELTVVVIMMARIQPANDNAASEPSYDAKAISEVNASTRGHEQVNRVQRKTIIHISNDDQIDFNIIFDDPYVENNGGTSEHD
ncbi:integrase, catalytic region, zinc finger, CCHC-type containing protein [Tanacetum coccineum]